MCLCNTPSKDDLKQMESKSKCECGANDCDCFPSIEEIRRKVKETSDRILQ